MFGSLFFINLIIYIESSISEDMASNAEFICNFLVKKDGQLNQYVEC